MQKTYVRHPADRHGIAGRSAQLRAGACVGARC